jgi:hypothetical protein
MRLEPYAAAAVLLALTACGGASKNDGKADQKAETAGPKVADAGGVVGQINPGEWEMTVESSVEGLSNMPAAAAGMMKGTKATSRSCVTPEEARQPPEDMFSGGHQDCKITEQQISGGSLHSALACSGTAGTRTVITTDGRFGGDAIDVRSRIETSGRGPAMTITSHLNGHRVGDCPAGKG